LRRHALVLTDEDGNSRDRYSIFKSLVFDTTLEDAQGETFHLCEGNWYRIDDTYIARLSAYLDPLCEDSDLPPYDHPSEGEYNAAVGAGTAIACLDTKNISPDGQSAVEPCDLLAVRDGVAAFYHVKVSTLSAQLSHLFNQGVNAIELMRLEPQAVDKLEALIREVLADGDGADAMVTLVRDRKCRIVFGIAPERPRRAVAEPALVLPHQPWRGMKALQLMDVPGRDFHRGPGCGSGRPQEEAEEEGRA
jgi:uncharacterized protein (TIGR04141 family)